jgi:hypothetical protein
MVCVNIAFNASDLGQARFILERIAMDIEAGNELGEGWYIENSEENTDDAELLLSLMDEVKLDALMYE